MYHLALGKATMKKRSGQKPVTERLRLLWMFSLLNTITKPESDKYDRSICFVNDNKSSQDSCPGWKSYIHICSEREARGGIPFECTAEALYCSLDNGAGICIVKGPRRKRWGTLTGSLWGEESCINCSERRLPSLSMGLRLQFQVKYQVWIQKLNTYLGYCSP